MGVRARLQVTLAPAYLLSTSPVPARPARENYLTTSQSDTRGCMLISDSGQVSEPAGAVARMLDFRPEPGRYSIFIELTGARKNPSCSRARSIKRDKRASGSPSSPARISWWSFLSALELELEPSRRRRSACSHRATNMDLG